MKKVITISREFGSGGHDIGMEVAKRLNIPFYDQEIVDKAVAESGFTKEFIEEHGEYSTLSSVLLGTSAPFDSYYYAEDPQDKIFKIQRRIIKKFAQEGPCVIVGRCADYALEDNPYAVSVFIKASLDERVQRIKRIYELNDSKAADLIQKTDKRRASYYNYYSSKKWGEAKSYNLCIDSGLVGVDGAIDMILKFIELKEKNMGKDI